MEYNDLFIYQQDERYGYRFIVCRFMVDRYDMETILCVEEGSFVKLYFEIPYKNKDKIYTIDQFEEKIIEENNRLYAKLEVLENIKKLASDYGNGLIGRTRIILDLQSQLEKSKCELNSIGCSYGNYVQIKRYINDLEKGIRRHKKRIWQFYDTYKNISYEDVGNYDVEILKIKHHIKRNSDDIVRIKKILLEKKGNKNV